MKTAVVCGAGGFIGGHLVRRLKHDGFWVRAIDLKPHEFSASAADEFVLGDLRDRGLCHNVIDRQFDELYQLAADMGGTEFIHAGMYDAEIMHNSMTINLNVLEACRRSSTKRVFFPSSACVYPQRNQCDASRPSCAEDTVYPAEPDSDYGWEKLFAERLYLGYGRCHGLEPRIARYHNVFGPEGAWSGGREKAPAALCRKIVQAEDGEAIEIFGDGKQTRSFLYISQCIEGTIRLTRSGVGEPLNIGSEQSVTIDRLADLIIEIAGKKLFKKHIFGPTGVRGRTSDNRLIRAKLGWAPEECLQEGLQLTYAWIQDQLRNRPR
jgi:GDP-D-mannose 3',5'-epimerase